MRDNRFATATKEKEDFSLGATFGNFWVRLSIIRRDCGTDADADATDFGLGFSESIFMTGLLTGFEAGFAPAKNWSRLLTSKLGFGVEDVPMTSGFAAVSFFGNFGVFESGLKNKRGPIWRLFDLATFRFGNFSIWRLH